MSLRERLYKALSVTAPEELSGLRLEGDAWEIDGRNLPPAEFFGALPILLTGEEVLVLQGDEQPPALLAWLEARRIEPRSKLAFGTIWPRPRVIHCAIPAKDYAALVLLTKACAEPEIATHVQLYRPGTVVLEWWDAFSSPMFISKQLPEPAVRGFSERIGRPYTELAQGLPPAW
jgi:hypothetical protein